MDAQKLNLYSYLQLTANDSFNLFVSIFVSFSINGLKENAGILNCYPILRREVDCFICFCQLTVNENVFFLSLLPMLSVAATIKVSVVYLQCSLPC